ncbi:MAG: mechanosensitive ion channel family protein [Haloferacaceae archaeon]
MIAPGRVGVALLAQANATATGGSAVRRTLGQWLPEWLLFPGLDWVLALAILLVGIYLSKFVGRLLGRTIARRFRRQSVAQTVLRLVRLVTVALFGTLALNVLGLKLGNIVLSVTVFSAVLGVVLAPLVGNFIGGLFILADQPYEIGDMIELDDGTRGFVEDITIRYTKVFTLQNTFMVLPNSTMRDRDVTNYSAEDERTWLSLSVLITYESDVDEAMRLLERAASTATGVIEGGPDIRIGTARYPATPTCLLDEYADSGISLKIRFWAEKPYRLNTVRATVRENFRDLIQESDADVEFAYPHQHLVFDDTSGTARLSIGEAEAVTEFRDEEAPQATRRSGPAATPEESTEPTE